jgi:hypothetical protein
VCHALLTHYFLCVQKNLPHLQGDDTPRDIPHERAVLIRQNKTKECTLMVSILLAIFYQTEATPKQLLELLQLFKKISEAFKRATTDLDIFSVRCPYPSVIAFVSTHRTFAFADDVQGFGHHHQLSEPGSPRGR